MMTYTPATFRYLPTELRLMIFDAMIDSTPALWHLWPEHISTRMGEFSIFTLLHRSRLGSVLALAKLNRESRQHVLSRFWFAMPTNFEPCLFPATWMTTRYAVDTKIDTFDLNTYLTFESTSFMNSCLLGIRTMTLTLERLGYFLDGLSSGLFPLSALKKIYVKIYEVESSDQDPRDIPTLQSASADDELAWARVICRTSASYSTARSATQEELAPAKYIHANDGFKEMDRTGPVGWGERSTMNWSVLERLGLTCVFIYDRIPSPREVPPPLYHSLYVFSTSRGPESKI
ncbi:hypothetical protein E0Z10_g3279 [Xylaria hypoxylon]|uniref:Uncharacterized protein n=1 Tax=Xylaria hypoxylon TaxID=37992 RepID=A0A4Z0YMK8_9PEZI|nr:hypothetical protein E0Z10_g3279 [Xylaria hypoxylon]